jgi:hypothetical protein
MQEPGSDCICPNCGFKMPGNIAVPCYHRSCPKCGTPMSQG